MDMDDNLSILLYVAEGTGFDLKIGNIVIVATLGGKSLETKPVQSSSKIEFDNNLIWETNKKSVKRMKTENLPIKIECFLSSFANGQETFSLIGYVLIPLKSIPVTLSKNRTMSKPHWHKLFGLNSEWKIKKPEVCLQVLISDDVPQRSLGLYGQKNQTSNNNFALDSIETSAMLCSQKGLYIELLNEEELLQVGDKKTNCDIFTLNLKFLNANNLDYAMNLGENKNQHFKLKYNLLGTSAYCSLVSTEKNILSIQEEIGINFRTSLQSLQEYLSKVFYIPVEFFYGDSLVGTALFNLKNILQVDSLNEFLAKYGFTDRTFSFKGTFPIQTVSNTPKSALVPYMEFIFNLKLLSTNEVSDREIEIHNMQKSEFVDNVFDDKKVSEENTNEEATNNVVEVISKSLLNDQDNFYDANNNSQVVNDEKITETKSEIALLENLSLNKESILFGTSKSFLDVQENFNDTNNNSHVVVDSKTIDTRLETTIQENSPLNKNTLFGKNEILIKEKLKKESPKNIPRTFSFNLILQTVKFNRFVDTGIWQISLQHQNADTTYTVANIELTEISSNLIEFKNFMLQLFFSSRADTVLEVVSSESCVLKICGPRGIFAVAELNNEILLTSNKEKHSGVVLMENQNGEKCALAYISVYMEDLGISFNSQIKKHVNNDNNPPTIAAYFDENLAYKVVEELEDWKKKQLENFLVELKRKEVNHLAMLSLEWQKRKSELENSLSKKLEECSQLYDTLEKAHLTLKEKGLSYSEHEKLVEKIRKDTEEKFSKIITGLNEKIKRIEYDMEHKIKLEQLKYKELELENINMEKEKFSLKKDLDELHKICNEMKENYVPKEQLIALLQDMSVLHERLEEVQKSQQFYKCQWAKLIRELHKMKIENLQTIEEQTTFCGAVQLHNLLQNEKNEFYNERDQLNEIKAALENSSDDDCESCYESDR
ncbi:centrosomal protein of 120 kDa [Condylostylus longicornis]|uniref:centrosomal protein of 120 kDa n=1 Tax=Condylostylus longicornis TaxID=2530218 RepID=UPI00244E3E87|nr:centrosomal protein of 120 kDa [Condylostylus longicornis]XP_055382423.1 centrosomal protein of 120 kDa [Condylostylus longicornis]